MHRLILAGGTLHEFGVDALPSIEVIAKQLSHINKFNGALGAYTVAQHCVLASINVESEDLRLSALLHDAHKIILGDVPPQVKGVPWDNQLESLGNMYQHLVDTQFDVTTRHPQVKECDARMLATEITQLGGPLELVDCEPFQDPIHLWGAATAEQAFLSQYYHLTQPTDDGADDDDL